MTTLSNRIDSVATNILTAKQDLRQAILDKEGTVGENPTFEELKNGINGISTGTTINYEEYYPDLNEIQSIKNIDVKLPATNSYYGYYPEVHSPLFYISYLGGIFYGHSYNYGSDSRCFVKYNWSNNTLTILYSFDSLFQNNNDPYSANDYGSINIVPYDSNIDDIASPSLKYYFCQGNIIRYSNYSTSKGIYSYDLVTNTASLLANFSHWDNCFFNCIDSKGNIDKEYLYAISVHSTCYVSKMNKSTFAVSLINSSNFWTSDQSIQDWNGASPFVYPWIKDKVYAQIRFANRGSNSFTRSGSYSFLTDTFSLVSGRYECCHNQFPFLLRKGSWWGKYIQGYSYVLNDDSLPSSPYIYLEYLLTSYYSSTTLEDPPYLLPIYNLPFLYSLYGRTGFYTTFHYLLPTNGKICECNFNQKVFQMRKKDNGLWALNDIATIHPKNTTFVTEEGYSYIIIEGPITGYIKYI